MKRLIFILAILLSSAQFSQQASAYFPPQLGYVWYFKTTVLDSLNQPVDSLAYYEVDSLASLGNYKGVQAYFTLSKVGPLPGIQLLPYIDTSYTNLSGTEAKTYFRVQNLDSIAAMLHRTGLDTLLGGFNFLTTLSSFEKWYTMYKFSSGLNVAYTIFQYDTTVTINTTTLPLRFLLKGKRVADVNLATKVGTFLCKVFDMEFSVSYVVTLPPPLPPLVVPLLTIADSLYFAPGMWQVRRVVPSSTFDLSMVGYGAFSIPGQITEIVPKFVTAVQEPRVSPKVDFKLSQNYPNPFNPETKINYSILSDAAGETFVKLTIYDALGNEVAILVNQAQRQGEYSVGFNASSFPSSTYFCELRAGGHRAVRKMTLLK